MYQRECYHKTNRYRRYGKSDVSFYRNLFQLDYVAWLFLRALIEVKPISSSLLRVTEIFQKLDIVRGSILCKNHALFAARETE